jgi:hypothetical protein
MYVPTTIQLSRERKISEMIQDTGCSRDEAISYLFAESWFLTDAVLSYRIDKRAAAEKSSAADHIGA